MSAVLTRESKMTHGYDDRCKHPSREVMLHGARENIREHGWHCTGVFAGEGSPPFAYTAGLAETYGHPELIVAGLDPQTGHSLLAAAVKLIAGGDRMTDGCEREKIAAGFPVRFSAAHGWLPQCTVTSALYGHDPALLQLVWPDVRGRFPGDPGCEPGVFRVQQPPAAVA